MSSKPVSSTINGKPRYANIAVSLLPWVVALSTGSLYLITQSHALGGGDSGDLVAAAATRGIAHPPGYPLFVLLGWLLIRLLPWGSPAWRVGFLSSVPSALAVFFIWKVAYRVTGKAFWSTVASLVYAVSFPVFLHATGQEVFGLFALASSVFSYLFLRWIDTRDATLLSPLALVAGLGVAHHQLMLFVLAPAVFVAWRDDPVYRRQISDRRVQMIVFLLLGFLPYLYAPIASLLGTPYDREHPASPYGFLRLISRASYGPFRAASGIGGTLLERILNIYTFLRLIVRDIGITGAVCALVGLVRLRARDDIVYRWITASLASWLFFFFYAGFPLILGFHIGTFERFVIVPYQLVAILAVSGFQSILSWAMAIADSRGIRSAVSVPILAFVAVFGVAWSVWPHAAGAYRSVRDAGSSYAMERLADNYLSGAPEGAIMHLGEDTAQYAVSYAHYVLGRRPDVTLLHFGSFTDDATVRRTLNSRTGIVYPERRQGERITEYVGRFLSANGGATPIVSDTIVSDAGYWIPNGLLLLFVPDAAHVPSVAQTVGQNTHLWSLMRIPERTDSIGSLYLLADTRRVYAAKRSAYAAYLALADRPGAEILDVLGSALRYDAQLPDGFTGAVDTLISKKRCTDAIAALDVLADVFGGDYRILERFDSVGKACPQEVPLIERRREEFRTLRSRMRLGID